MRLTVNFAGWILIVTSVLVGAELISFVLYRHILLPHAAFLCYTPPTVVSEDEYEKYRKLHDPLLGWPNTNVSPGYDIIGARISPSFPEPGQACVSLFGDSFVFSSEVNDESAWGNLLAEKLACRVNNFGVGGYGTDQAYLRFTSLREDSKLVIVGIYPHDIMRNVNQYQYFLTGDEVFGFKPRFVLQKNLQRLPLPEIPYAEFQSFLKNPSFFLAAESFLPGGDLGPEPFSFPYSFSVIKTICKQRTLYWLQSKPSWGDFMKPGHPTKAFEITVAIIRKFQDDCRRKGKKLLVLFIPTPSSYALFTQKNILIESTFLAAIKSEDLAILNLTEEIAAHTSLDNLCSLLTDPQSCNGHFNEEGNRLIASIVAERIKQHKLCDSAGK